MALTSRRPRAAKAPRTEADNSQDASTTSETEDELLTASDAEQDAAAADEEFGDEQVTESVPEVTVDVAEEVLATEPAEVAATAEPSEVAAAVAQAVEAVSCAATEADVAAAAEDLVNAVESVACAAAEQEAEEAMVETPVAAESFPKIGELSSTGYDAITVGTGLVDVARVVSAEFALVNDVIDVVCEKVAFDGLDRDLLGHNLAEVFPEMDAEEVEVLKEGVETPEAVALGESDDAELEGEVAATTQEIVDAVEMKATPPHVVSATAITSAVIGTLLGLIDTVEFELEGADCWKPNGLTDPAPEDVDEERNKFTSSFTKLNPGTSTSRLSPRFEQNDLPENVSDTPLPTAGKDDSHPVASDEDNADSVRDQDFVELVQLPEPSPAELSAAAVSVAVVGALLDAVGAIDAEA
ncbi:hypothetical protein ON010_g6662 [Phytophthora cinnamomi]|nr:hypothetical protein ON010_g6662 [Phytophthora cinnamomi]